jgi:hypothetical protein
VRKTLSTMMLAWALWWVQELVHKPEMPLDIVKLSVHDTQEACEQRASIRRQWEEDLYQQEIQSFDWNSKPWPKYMLRLQTFTCIPT